MHIKFIKGPRRARKDHERANMMDRLTEMEDVMLEMGYLKRKKNLKKNRKTKNLKKNSWKLMKLLKMIKFLGKKMIRKVFALVLNH